MKPLTLRNILVGIDLSPDSIAALQNARRLADLSGAALHVLHAVESPAEAAKVEERLAELLPESRKQLDLQVLMGPPAALIAQEAGRTEADVIVLGGHHGRSGALGSTADRVVRTARVSCLILPTRLELPLRSVLVPVDDNEAARGTLGVGLTWASALRRRASGDGGPTAVRVVHVARDEVAVGQTQLATRLHAQIEDITSRLADVAGVTIEQNVATSRDVPGTILREADDRGANLIVLGTRGERIESDPLGSVSSAVVKSSSKPILLVPPEVWRPDANEFPPKTGRRSLEHRLS